MVKSESHNNLIFDMAVPEDLMGQKNAIKQQLDDKLNDRSEKKIYTVITFDPAAFN
jgi:hypothetical protein